MPPEADRKIVLSSEAFSDAESCIERLFSLDVPAGIVTDISDGEFYVGASRARIGLEIMTVMDNESCRNALDRTKGVGT